MDDDPGSRLINYINNKIKLGLDFETLYERLNDVPVEVAFFIYLNSKRQVENGAMGRN